METLEISKIGLKVSCKLSNKIVDMKFKSNVNKIDKNKPKNSKKTLTIHYSKLLIFFSASHDLNTKYLKCLFQSKSQVVLVF